MNESTYAHRLHEFHPSPWMKPSEAAAYLKVSSGTLSLMRSEERGPRYSRDEKGGIWYHVCDLDHWLHSKAVRPQEGK